MIYLDTSAALKLIQCEPESEAPRTYLAERPDSLPVSSRLLRVELLRAIRRIAPELLAGAYGVLDRIDVVGIDQVVTAAESCGPAMTRSLDAIHLATAVRLRSALEAFVAYDKRLVTAAEAEGLPVVSPS